jgi:hypothetical protein
MQRRALLILAIFIGLGLTAETGSCRLLISREDALASVFGDSATVDAKTLYLTTAQVAAIKQAARAPFDRKRVTYYEVTVGDTLAGLVFVDKHLVRTLSETVLIALDPGGEVLAVEILAWNEPDDYRPSERWLDLADGKDEIAGMRPGEDMPRLAGSTLSARAMTEAIRRALALGRFVLTPEEEE